MSATIPEILRLAHGVRGKQPRREQIAAVAMKSRQISQNQRAVNRLVYPILEQQICSEYALCPLVCRSLLSADEPFAYAGNTVEIRTYIVIMMKAALILGGLPHQHYEMSQALAVALAQEDTEDRWLAGEPVFSEVDIDTSDLRPSKLTNLVERLVDVVKSTL